MNGSWQGIFRVVATQGVSRVDFEKKWWMEKEGT